MLICDICGGELVMDTGREFAVCQNCGMRYLKFTLKAMAEKAPDVEKEAEKKPAAVPVEPVIAAASAYFAEQSANNTRILVDLNREDWAGSLRDKAGYYVKG
ncbi:MAG: hypothetical protein LBK23_01915 [Oscillospiraceae bacterium]|jgi:predicted  nucleic acid-binding Zn-ribbon protein|nr:hypothetical protein [Oscillospiraceae bacterium]